MPRYFLTLPDPATARGPDAALSFTAQGPEAFAAELQAALRTPTLFERWRSAQPDPDAVEPSLGATDPGTVVVGRQRSLSIDLEVDTKLPGPLVRTRLRWLAGTHWQLRDVRN